MKVKYFKDSICGKCNWLENEYEAGNMIFWCAVEDCDINPFEEVLKCKSFDKKGE